MDIYNKPPLSVYLQHYNKPSLKEYLAHHGIKDQKWGVRRGPPYPLTPEQKNSDTPVKKVVAKTDGHDKIGQEVLTQAIESGEISLKINLGHQKKHLPDREDKRRSYIQGDLATAQRLVTELSGTGSLVILKNGHWLRKERVVAKEQLGVCVDLESGEETQTDKLMIHYGKKGTHIYGRKDGE